MAPFPHFDPADVATKSDVAAVKTEFAELRSDVRVVGLAFRIG
jgi:hypothetical protein